MKIEGQSCGERISNPVMLDDTTVESCNGMIELKPVKNCSCHISAPCYGHENQKLYCPECGWEDE